MMQTYQKPAGHKRFFWLLSVLLLLIFVRYALQIDLPREIYLLIIFPMALLGTPTEIIAVCMCCIPLHESIDFFYAVVICMVSLVAKCHRRIRVNSSLFIFLLMIVWELLHCFGGSFSLMDFLVSIIPLIALAIFMCIDPAEYDYAFTVRVFSLTTAALCITLLGKVFYASGFNIAQAILGLQRLGMETGKQGLSSLTGAVNPNTLGIICVLATTGLMQLRNAGQGTRKDMVLAIILMVFGALTSSRTYLACLAAMFLLLVFAQDGGIGKKLRFIGIMLLLLAVALVALYLIFPTLLEYYISRFFEADISTGRFDLMAKYHDFIFSNPHVMLFGIGRQDFGDKVLILHRVGSHVPHNGIQELIVAWGIPGLLLFAAMLFAMCRQSLCYSRKFRLISLIPLLILLLKAQAGQMITSAYTMLAFSYAYLSMCQNFSRKKSP